MNTLSEMASLLALTAATPALPVAAWNGRCEELRPRRICKERPRATKWRGLLASLNTRHLLTIGFDAKGVPTSMALDTGNPEVDAVDESLVAMHQAEIEDLLAKRDESLMLTRAQTAASLA